MAKKKPPLEGIGRDPENKLVVQKANPLSVLGRSELSLAELKILDMYLARINTRNPDQRTVKLTKGQLENALGVTRINRADLELRLKNLYQPIDLANGTKNRLHLIGLFEEAAANQDEDGVWQVTLTCTPSAMKYIFKAEVLGYFRYGLRSIINLSSRYTYVLFTYLERNRYRKVWDVPLTELKETLKCEDDDSYSKFKVFNDRILKRCQKEILEKTECRFTYEPIRKGRSVAVIRFTIETLPSLELPGQISLDDLDSPPDDQIEFLRGACTPKGSLNPEFSRTEMEQLFEVLVSVDDAKLPENVPTGGIEFRRYHYLSERYAAMNRAAEKRPVKHRFAYMLKLVKADAGIA